MRRPQGHPILASFLDLAMKPMEGIRHRVVPLATGKVLEIGVGTGMNASFYDLEAVTELVGIEPDPHMLKRARPRFDALPCPTKLLQAGAEDLPFSDLSFDTIVLTFTLCTIPDTEASIREMHRVLRPTGTLLFAEHTTSDHKAMRTFQGVINPMWGVFAGGCHLNRDAVAMLRSGGFVIDEVHGHGRGQLNLSPVHRGVAIKALP